MMSKIIGYACVDDDGLEYVMCRQCSDQLDRATRKLGLARERANRVVTLTKEDTSIEGWDECIQCRRQL